MISYEAHLRIEAAIKALKTRTPELDGKLIDDLEELDRVIADEFWPEQPLARSTDDNPWSIGRWADETFGKIEQSTALGIALSSLERARKEWNELERAAQLAKMEWEQDTQHFMTEAVFAKHHNNVKKIAMEMADVCIVLMRGLNSIGEPNAINEKMTINRSRKWEPTGDGHGKHIKDGAEAGA